MTQQEFEKNCPLFPSFPNYTKEMYEGNEPCGTGHKLIDGGITDRWSCKYGGAETYNGEIIDTSFNINTKICVFISGEHLWITNFKYSGKPDIWEYSNDDGMRFPHGCLSEQHRHQLTNEEVEKILNTKIDNCKLWDMIQKRAIMLYESTDK